MGKLNIMVSAIVLTKACPLGNEDPPMHLKTPKDMADELRDIMLLGALPPPSGGALTHTQGKCYIMIAVLRDISRFNADGEVVQSQPDK